MRKLLTLALLLLAAVPSLYARERAYGYCSQGGVRVYVSNVGSSAPAPSFATTYWMQSYPNCTVTVYLTGTTTPATLYSDNSGTPLSNPFTANSNGYWRFYADAGRYDVRFSGTGSGIQTPFTTADIELCDFTSEVCSTGGGGGGTTPHNLLSATHPDTVPFTPPAPGDMILGGLPTPQKWQQFPGNSTTTRKFYSQIGNGTNVTSADWLQIGGDCGALPIVKVNDDGTVVCGTAGSNATYQYNDVTVATQPILDIKDSANITWSIVNDAANNRVQATATANTTPSCDLTQVVNWYVSPTGSDSNNGSSGSPWLTIQHAIDAGVPAIVCGRYVIHLATGTYAGFQVAGRVFAGNQPFRVGLTNNFYAPFSDGAGDDTTAYSWIEVLGSSANPAAYSISDGANPMVAIASGNVTFRGIKLSSSGHTAVLGEFHSLMNFAGVIFGDCITCLQAGWNSRIHLDRSGTVNDAGQYVMQFQPTNNTFQFGLYLHDDSSMDDIDWSDSNTTSSPGLLFDLTSLNGSISRAIRLNSNSFLSLYESLTCNIKTSQRCLELLHSKAALQDWTVNGSGSLVTAATVNSSRLESNSEGSAWTINNATQGINLSYDSTLANIVPTGTGLTTPIYYVSPTNNPGGSGDETYRVAATQSSQITQVESVAFNSTVTFDMYLGGTKYMTLAGDSTLSAVTHNTDGQLLQTVLCQDSAGGHTFSFPVTFVNPPTISSAASTCSINQFVYLRLTNSWYTAGGGSGGGGGGGSGFAYLGTWNSGTSYSLNNIVSLTGSSYIALSSNIGVQPGTDGGVTWAVLAAAGAQGPAGTNGTNGTNGTDGAPGAPGYSPNQVLSGCGVAYASGLTFNVSACSYVIQNTTYGSAAGTATLAAADPSLDRIDAIVVNTSGAIAVVTGTPAATPAPPSIDISTQLQLTFAYVAAGATTPSNIVTTDIYHENAEWTCNATTHVNCASTSNPHSGTKDIEWTSSVSGNNVTLTIPAGTIDLATRNNLVFWIRSKATFPSGTSIIMQWFNGTTAKCTPVSLANGNFGFSSSNTTTYQQIVVPTSVFSCNGIPVTRIRFQQASSSTLTGFYLDDIILQGGVASSTGTAAMNWKGAWLNSTTYAVNDTVTYQNLTYTAIQTNTNQAPSSNPASWAVHSFSVAGVAGNLQYNNGTNILGALNTSVSGSDITFPGAVSASQFISTDTVNNTQISFLTGSSGDSTCGTPAASSSILCTKSGVVAQAKNGGSTYYPLATTNGTLTNGDCVSIDANGNLVDAGGACGIGGPVGGTNTNVQYNDSGSFGGDTGFTYNKTTHVVSIGVSGGNSGEFDLTGKTSGNTVAVKVADSTGAAAITLPGTANGTLAVTQGATVAGHCAQIASDGTGIVDAGGACSTTTSGSVMGTAIFQASTGSITNLYTSGVVTGVSRTSTGVYHITISALSNYTVAIIASDDNAFSMCAQVQGNTFASILTSTGFTFSTTRNCTTLGDPALIAVTIMKL